MQISLHTDHDLLVLIVSRQKAGISSLFGLDIASVSISHAEERYRTARSISFSAQFKTVDCFSVSAGLVEYRLKLLAKYKMQ